MMALTVLILRLILAGVFVVAALGKLTDRPGTREAVKGFGLPGPLVGAIALGLPVVELLVAALLLPGALAWWGALGALGLLLAFDVGIALSLARGDAPDCHCFGQLHSEPVGPRTLVRNGVLGALAVVILVQGKVNGDPVAFHTLSRLTNGEWITLLGDAVGLVLLGIVLVLLRRLIQQNEQVLLRLKIIESDVRGNETAAPAPNETQYGLPPGTAAPSFSLPDTAGVTVSLEDLYEIGKPILLVFTSPTCGPCNALMPEISQWQQDRGGDVEVVVISSGGTREQAESKRTEHGLARILFEDERNLEKEFQVPGTPAAVVIRPDGAIGSPVGAGADAVRWLLNEVLTMLQPAGYRPNAIQLAAMTNEVDEDREIMHDSFLGQPAPLVELPNLAGNSVRLADLVHGETLLLFWSATCTFCRGMTDDLRRWDASPPYVAPRLVVIASGSLEEVRALNLDAPVLYDQEFATAALFGINATPMGVMIDSAGTIASQTGGAEAIMRLLNPVSGPVLASVAGDESAHG